MRPHLLPACFPRSEKALAAACRLRASGRARWPARQPALSPLPAARLPTSCASAPLPPRSQYHQGGNNGLYARNVRRSACQKAAKDDWCESCDGKECTACFPRPDFGSPMGGYPIVQDPTTKRVRGRRRGVHALGMRRSTGMHCSRTPPLKWPASPYCCLQCVSKCPPGAPASVNCALCGSANECLRCEAGWRPDANHRCTVKARKRVPTTPALTHIAWQKPRRVIRGIA